MNLVWSSQEERINVESIIEQNGYRVKLPFLPQEEMIPIMPFHTILLDNFRFIPLFVGRGPNLRTQSKRLNMERPARGSAQMLACCSSAPAASTGQLGDHTEGQTPTTSLLALPLTFSFLAETNLPGTTGVPFRAAKQAPQSLSWGSCPVPYSLLANETPIIILSRPCCWLRAKKKSMSCSGVWLPFIERKSLIKTMCSWEITKWSKFSSCILWPSKSLHANIPMITMLRLAC